jgi:predicted ATPase
LLGALRQGATTPGAGTRPPGRTVAAGSGQTTASNGGTQYVRTANPQPDLVRTLSGPRTGDHPWVGPRPDFDPLVGRAADMERIRTSLRTDRWLVLTGPGGVGKTRLAIEVAQGARPDFPGGVTLLPLDDLPPVGPEHGRDADAVCGYLMDAVRPPASDPDEPHPPEGRLLIFDNAEHVLDAVIPVCTAMLERDDTVRLIVTSRHSIAVPAVRTWDVGPLGTSPHDRSTAAGTTEATTLLLRRAEAACPALDLSGQLSAVGELAATLDNMPQALESAALRLRSVSLSTLLRDGPIEHISEQPNITQLGRRWTLSESVRWSWDLLGPEHKALLSSLARLPGGFTIEDVQQAPSPLPSAAAMVHRLLPELVDSSLVQVQRGADYRYRLLGYVREFAAAWSDLEPPHTRPPIGQPSRAWGGAVAGPPTMRQNPAVRQF